MAAIDAAITTLVEEGLSRPPPPPPPPPPPHLDRIALAGFSQGGCLALEYAARRGGLAAVFGLSAGLVGTGDADGPATEALYGFGPKAFDYATRLDGVPGGDHGARGRPAYPAGPRARQRGRVRPARRPRAPCGDAGRRPRDRTRGHRFDAGAPERLTQGAADGNGGAVNT